MKAVYHTGNGGALYQASYKSLSRLDARGRAKLGQKLDLALALDKRADDDLRFYVFTMHLPFGDNKSWTGPNAVLSAAIAKAARTVMDGGGVLSYCFYGRNRSGLVNALILRQMLQCTGTEALQLLRRARPGAIGGNSHFVSWLEAQGAP